MILLVESEKIEWLLNFSCQGLYFFILFIHFLLYNSFNAYKVVLIHHLEMCSSDGQTVITLKFNSTKSRKEKVYHNSTVTAYTSCNCY